MNFAKFATLTALFVSAAAFSQVLPSVASETASCSTGSCKPAALPTTTTNNGVGSGSNTGGTNLPSSTNQSSSNSGSFNNNLVGGSAVSNSLGLSFGGNVNPAMFSVSGECSYPRNSNGYFVGGTFNGSPGSNGNSATYGGGIAAGWNSTNYDNQGQSVEMCNQLLEIKVTSANLRVCGEIMALQKANGVVINVAAISTKLAQTCQFNTVVVVETPPTPPVVVIQKEKPPVVNPPVYPTRVPQTGDIPTGQH
jgi:hypothetical protein